MKDLWENYIENDISLLIYKFQEHQGWDDKTMLILLKNFLYTQNSSVFNDLQSFLTKMANLENK